MIYYKISVTNKSDEPIKNVLQFKTWLTDSNHSSLFNFCPNNDKIEYDFHGATEKEMEYPYNARFRGVFITGITSTNNNDHFFLKHLLFHDPNGRILATPITPTAKFSDSEIKEPIPFKANYPIQSFTELNENARFLNLVNSCISPKTTVTYEIVLD